MSIKLYEHNKIAYESALAMMEECGKAAVIHPTGTGKSFIGFKLCEEHPDKLVCWLSPSEHIFNTQIENLRAANGYEPENICFYTYVKLMQMNEKELGELKPDFIVLDEFHRCGAQMWGRGVERLLSIYKEAKILGLSATNIRYLDNRRDMADELFDGNVASEMTLGEAIVRGILNPPKYVTAVYSYKKDIDRLERRTKGLRNKSRRERAEETLERLRRALEKADGLDRIFEKHMADRHGKYIVFCSNAEHMREMAEQSEHWFYAIDNAPHKYFFYHDDPRANKEFAAFKADGDKSHLRLLFCIDALNEGVHIDGVDGVILLRPTISPIIYKQQIGRALSASKEKNPIIFDIVDNIAGLYSVDSIKEEMREAARYYGFTDEERNAVYERFDISDEVFDCRRLFDELEETLNASWDFMYAEAKSYYEENGDLLAPQSYVSESGARLGKWLTTQRNNYRRDRVNGISPLRVERLNAIGMNWQTQHERQWTEGYELAQAYFKSYGKLSNINQNEKHEKNTSEEINLSRLNNWLIRQRQKHRDGQLSDEQFKSLTELGMVWEFEDGWEIKYAEAERYYREHGSLDIPARYITESGVSLGAWYRGVREQQRLGLLSKERKQRLEAIGIKWESIQKRSWKQFYECAKKYYEEHGDLNINANYETPDGVKLGIWTSTQRYNKKKGRLSDEQISLLNEINMSWHRYASKWDEAIRQAKEYFEENGELDPTVNYTTAEGFALGKWVVNQRKKYASGKLKPEQTEALEVLKITWNPAEDAWLKGYEKAGEYKQKHGDLIIPNTYITDDGFKLGIWIANQRNLMRGSRLSEDRKRLLDELGMVWEVQSDRWHESYEKARECRAQNGSINLPQKFMFNGFPIGEWVATQRKAYRDKRLSEEKIELLEGLGILWSANAEKWNTGYIHAAQYATQGGVIPIPQTYVAEDGYRLGEWIRSQERRYKKGVLEEERIIKLAEIGVLFGT